MANGYNSTTMNRLIKAEYAARTTPARLAVIRAAQVQAAKEVPIIPYWQGKMIAVSRSNVTGHRQHAGRRVPHAVLADLEVLAT